MPSSYTTSSFLSAFGAAYETMDVRAALVRYQDKWALVALSAHLRISLSDTAKAEFTEIETRCGAIHSGTFRVFQTCYPMAEVESFFDKLAKGELVFEGGYTIAPTSPVDMLSRLGSPRNNDFYNKGGCWPFLEMQYVIARNDAIHGLLHGDGEITRTAENAGYENPDKAVQTLLDVDFSSPGWVWLKCDIPVRLLHPDVSKSASNLQLKLHVQTHSVVEDVSCNVHWNGTYTGNRSGQAKVKLDPESRDEKIAFWCGTIDLPLDRRDHVTLDIVSSKIGKLYSIGTRPFDFLPPEQRNPLLAALELFCSPKELTVLLSEPQKNNAGSSNDPKAQKLFEVSIQWLLSILGFYSICLQGYEKYQERGKDSDKPFDYGTADCLAYSEDEDLLLIVHCTILPPNPNELGKYANLAERVRDLLFPDEKVNVRSAVFTASYNTSNAQQRAYGPAIKIFYRDDIEQLLQTAKAGQKLDYLRRLMFAPFTD